jgi:hypothetical protein
MQQTLHSKQPMMKRISEALNLFKKWISVHIEGDPDMEPSSNYN